VLLSDTQKKELGLFRVLFRHFLKNIIACFRPRVLPWHILAMLFTWGLVVTGFDWVYYTAARGANVRPFFSPALVLGSLFPMVAPIFLYVYGRIKRNIRVVNIAAALGQSALVGLLLSFFYKAFTGRMQPRFAGAQSLVDTSHGFRFGFLEGGVFWGWPSSHTTVAFAVAFALIALFPRNRFVQVVAFFCALYVGIGVATVGIHWFSEFVAGAIFGAIAGLAVGSGFKDTVSSGLSPGI
jgi:membrane-associated phospholipid phosphatase